MRSRVVLITLGAVVVLTQLVPVSRSNPPVETEISAPDEVRALLRRACYDCHSNETRWPWYAYVAPASWLVASDVSDAREKMNFSTWNRYSEKKRGRRFGHISDELEEQGMPPWQYLLLHPEARLAAAEQDVLDKWAKSNTPPDEEDGASEPAASATPADGGDPRTGDSPKTVPSDAAPTSADEALRRPQ
jgi:hypothetical protein